MKVHVGRRGFGGARGWRCGNAPLENVPSIWLTRSTKNSPRATGIWWKRAESQTTIRRFEPLKKSSTPSPKKPPNRGPLPRRGEVWWVRLDPTLGAETRKTRLCLVLTTNIVNQHRRTVVVVPLSSSPAGSPPLLVPLTCEGRTAVAVVDQIRAVTKERFLRRIESISAQELRAVEDGLRTILEL